jgi:hypothetical protein
MNWRVALLFALVPFVFPSRASAGTIEDVRSSGSLTCGLDPDRPGFSVRNADYSWTGFDVDLCQSLAAAVIGQSAKANLTALTAEDRIVALQSGEVDVLFHDLPWTQGGDAKHGLMFVIATYAGPGAVQGKSDRASVIYGPMVRQGDDQWFHVVRGVVHALMSKPVSTDPQTDSALGLEQGWQERAINSTGSYRQIFERHFGPQTPFNMSVDPTTGLPREIMQSLVP